VNGIRLILPGAQPDWMMSNDERKRRNRVYVTLETIGHDKNATEMPNAESKKIAGPKSPWDPRRPNDERWKNTFFSEERSDGWHKKQK
jgi:hypothetical protein